MQHARCSTIQIGLRRLLVLSTGKRQIEWHCERQIWRRYAYHMSHHYMRIVPHHISTRHHISCYSAVRLALSVEHFAGLNISSDVCESRMDSQWCFRFFFYSLVLTSTDWAPIYQYSTWTVVKDWSFKTEAALLPRRPCLDPQTDAHCINYSLYLKCVHFHLHCFLLRRTGLTSMSLNILYGIYNYVCMSQKLESEIETKVGSTPFQNRTKLVCVCCYWIRWVQIFSLIDFRKGSMRVVIINTF